MSAPVRVGILGLGSIGRTHAAAVAALDGRAVVTAYATRGGGEGPAHARRADVADLVTADDVDLVVVAGPSELHAEHALAAIAAGKGIVVEKPLATTAADARRVVAAWRAAGVFGATISQRRLEPQHVALKALLDAGRLGTPVLGEVLVPWWREPSYYTQAPWRASAPGGGVLMNQALHSVDLLTWLLGPVETVVALTGTLVHDIEAEDTAAAALRFRDGGLGTVVASTATRPGDPARLTVRTTTGSVTLDQTTVAAWSFPDVELPGTGEGLVSGASDPSAIGIAGHLAQWRDIVDAYTTGRPAAVTVADGLVAVEVVDAIYRSAATGTAVRVGAP